MKKLITLLLCTTLVTACGWHLRGSLLLPENLQSLHISATDSHGRLATDLKKMIAGYDIKLVDNSNEAQFSLAILGEREERRTVSVGNDALAAEYELTLNADYAIYGAKGEVLVPKATATVIRSYDHDRNDVLSTGEEERLIREEMRIDLIQQIIRRLSFASQQTTAPAQQPPAQADNGQTAS